MTQRDFTLLGKRLLPSLPGFSPAGCFLFLSPLGETLRGIYFESHTSSPTAFYVWAFFLPLYIPTERLHFNLGRRIPAEGATLWDANMPDLVPRLIASLEREAIPLLSSLQSADDVVHVARQLAAATNDPYVHQAIAFALARAGHTKQAAIALEHLARSLNMSIPWQATMANRATLLMSLLSEPSGAALQLDGWVKESIRNLHLKCEI